jgi:hypothetical protein
MGKKPVQNGDKPVPHPVTEKTVVLIGRISSEGDFLQIKVFQHICAGQGKKGPYYGQGAGCSLGHGGKAPGTGTPKTAHQHHFKEIAARMGDKHRRRPGSSGFPPEYAVAVKPRRRLKSCSVFFGARGNFSRRNGSDTAGYAKFPAESFYRCGIPPAFFSRAYAVFNVYTTEIESRGNTG